MEKPNVEFFDKVFATIGPIRKDEATVDLAIERGVTLITCTNPDVVLDLLRKKGKRTK